MEKTKVLPINTDQTPKIKREISIKILEQYQYIDILGIHFSEDLNDTILVNWQKTLTKMEKHIQKLMTRQLSLYGKSIIINTLILAKTTFLSNIFPIPEKIIQKIHTNIFQYLWQNKTPEPIARKMLFQPKNKGGLNIKEAEPHNLAMRIKHSITLKQIKKQPPCMHIAIYWLGKDIYNYNEFYHLKGSNIIKRNKTPPFYYRDFVHYIKTQNSNIPNLQNKTKIIYKSILEKGSQNHNIFGEKIWKDEIKNLDVKKIWTNTYFSYTQPDAKDLLYKFLHYATKTNKFVFTISRDKTGLTPTCDYCNIKEDNIHLFTTSTQAKKIWQYFQSTYEKLTKQQYTPQQHIFTLSANNLNSKNKKLMLVLTQLIIHEIWTSRNNIKHDIIHLSQETITTKILTQLRNILTEHYKLHKLNETLPTFQQLFCINNALRKIYNGKLQIIIQYKIVRVLPHRITPETTQPVVEVLPCKCAVQTTKRTPAMIRIDAVAISISLPNSAKCSWQLHLPG